MSTSRLPHVKPVSERMQGEAARIGAQTEAWAYTTFGSGWLLLDAAADLAVFTFR